MIRLAIKHSIISSSFKASYDQQGEEQVWKGIDERKNRLGFHHCYCYNILCYSRLNGQVKLKIIHVQLPQRVLWIRLQRCQPWGRKKVKPQNENGRSKHDKQSGTEMMLIAQVMQKGAEFSFGARCVHATFQNLKSGFTSKISSGESPFYLKIQWLWDRRGEFNFLLCMRDVE